MDEEDPFIKWAEMSIKEVLAQMDRLESHQRTLRSIADQFLDRLDRMRVESGLDDG